ncbi:DUF2141 domain-containing protein [Derxia gummosa]|uniref:DUF2141 domain-containing protein n=1 Tax=Derxia gummosa DSM 723 TaxID=1121388 RepID=A0A8B6X9X4_9BURK|nr:DUF2141 domain-containing protein [Derxia gummosa]
MQRPAPLACARPARRLVAALPVAALALAASLAAPAARAADLTVDIDGAASQKGHLAVAVYDRAERFPEEGAHVVAQRVAPLAGRTSVTFRNLAPGNYAVAVYHDENDNEKLDKGMFGIPKEPYGFSNDARGRAGPPDFRDARIALGDPAATVLVHLR